MPIQQAVFGLPLGGKPAHSLVPLAGLVLWLRPQSLARLADTAPISVWGSSGGLPPIATAAGSAQPLYRTHIYGALPGVYFDGADDFLTISNMGLSVPNAAHLFLVASPQAANYAIYNSNNARDSWWALGSEGYQACFRSNRLEGYPASGMSGTGTHYMELKSSSDTYEFFMDGVSKGVCSPSYESGLHHTIGDRHMFTGFLGDVLLYNAIQSPMNQGRIRAYLKSEYRL